MPVDSSAPPRATVSTEPIDRLSGLLRHFHVSAQMFHSGPLCGVTPFYDGPELGHLHVLQQGALRLTHYGDASPLGSAELDEPTLLFYPCAAPHRFTTPLDGGTRMVCATVRFEGGPSHPVAAALPPLVIVPLARVPELAHTVQALFAEAVPALAPTPRCGRQLICDRLFEALLVQLVRWLVDHPPAAAAPGMAPTTGSTAGQPLQGLLAGLAHPRLARALTAIHEQPGQPWDLPRLAATAGMSRSAFAAAFHRQVGVAPGDYLTQWRMALAGQQLARGEPLKAVAQALGYSSPSALSRAFSARVGAPPRAWLRQAQGEDGS